MSGYPAWAAESGGGLRTATKVIAANNSLDKTKADYCKDNDIAIHIDDSMVYNEYFTTPFARLWTKTNTPKVNKPKRMLS